MESSSEDFHASWGVAPVSFSVVEISNLSGLRHRRQKLYLAKGVVELRVVFVK